MTTKIEGCDETWKPVTGCTKISAGCENCYAEQFSKRLAGRYGYPEEDPFSVTFHEDRLEQPLQWKKPRRIMVCSMGDLFHPEVKDNWLDKYGRVIDKYPQHRFIILTKRPGNFLKTIYAPHVAPNIWFGVSAENQKTFDERVPKLLMILARIRFVSCEPLLGPINLGKYLKYCWNCDTGSEGRHFEHRGKACDYHDGPCSDPDWCGCENNRSIDWVIAGGETGMGARKMKREWVQEIQAQCAEVLVPFFFKQWGGKRGKDRKLDGQQWNQFPGVYKMEDKQ